MGLGTRLGDDHGFSRGGFPVARAGGSRPPKSLPAQGVPRAAVQGHARRGDASRLGGHQETLRAPVVPIRLERRARNRHALLGGRLRELASVFLQKAGGSRREERRPARRRGRPGRRVPHGGQVPDDAKRKRIGPGQ